MYAQAAARLDAGETVTIRPRGNSMTPRIRSGQAVTLAPVPDDGPRKGDIVLAKVKGRWYVHLVVAVRNGRYQIANNHGHVNGWASSVHGVVVNVGG